MIFKQFNVLFSIFIASLAVEHVVRAQRVGWEYKSWAVGRFFHISSDAPIRRVLNANQDRTLYETSVVIQDFIEYVEDAILDSLSKERRPNGNEPLRPCSYEEKTWRDAVDTNFAIRGWPEVNSDCITQFIGTRVKNAEEPPFTVPQIYDAAVERGRAGQRIANATWDASIGNRTAQTPELEPDFIVETPYVTAYQSCNLTAIAGARLGDSWNLKFGFTNEPKLELLPSFKRQSVMEHLRVEDGQFKWPLLKNMSTRGDNETDSVQFTNSTTLMASFRGDAGPSHYGSLYIADNPAILQALDESDLWIQQAQDALTPSSIAILILPLLLAVVPIALIADVSTGVMFMYTFISDVLAVVPLCVKGVELIVIGSRLTQSIVLRMTSGGTGEKLETSGAEVWAAQCGVRSHIRAVGITFVALALIFMVVGVSAEFVARQYVTHKKKIVAQQLNAVKRDEEAAMSLGANNSDLTTVLHTGADVQGDHRRRRNVQGREEVAGEADDVVAASGL